jgi:hypothetical protein
MEFGNHRHLAWDSPVPPFGECHCEANQGEAARWGQWASQGVWRAGHPLGPLVNLLLNCKEKEENVSHGNTKNLFSVSVGDTSSIR